MSKSLREWIDTYSAAQMLEKNLQANLDAMTDLDDQTKRALMRVNMIVVRQLGADCGLEE